MSNQPADFMTKQFEFTAHIRDPENQQVPAGIEPRRMKIYSDLFYNNIESFIRSAFPVLNQLYSNENWHKMVRDFFIVHRCQTPYFLEISQEFLSYLQDERTPQPEDPVYLLELAHYEWVELALMISDESISIKDINPNGDLLESPPVISPLAWPLAYHYPVHKIGPDYIPSSEPDNASYLVVYRDRNDNIEFMELNPVTARLLQLLNENNDISGREALEQIAQELQSDDPAMIIENGHAALQELQQHGILLGVK